MIFERMMFGGIIGRRKCDQTKNISFKYKNKNDWKLANATGNLKFWRFKFVNCVVLPRQNCNVRTLWAFVNLWQHLESKSVGNFAQHVTHWIWFRQKHHQHPVDNVQTIIRLTKGMKHQNKCNKTEVAMTDRIIHQLLILWMDLLLRISLGRYNHDIGRLPRPWRRKCFKITCEKT